MNNPLRELAGRFNVLSRRERGIVAGAIAIGVVFIGDSSAIDPALIARKRFANEMAQAASELSTTQTLITVASQLKDPDEPNRNALAQVRQEMTAVDAKFRELEAAMVPPEKMQAFLEALLSRHKNLELISLATLPPTPLRASAATGGKPAAGAATKETQPGLYRHGIQISIAGGYGELTDYLAALESMPQRVIWDSATLSVDRHPRNVLTLTVFTLSLDSQWLTM